MNDYLQFKGKNNNQTDLTKGTKNVLDNNTDGRLRTLSLFSGIGGIDYGLRTWCKTVCYCEIDPYAVGVLVKNMVQGSLDVAPVWDDIKTFGKSEIQKIAPIECVHGGFPCQDISGLGKKAGIKKGTRSGLFYEIIRIVCMVTPQIIFLENVHRLLAAGMEIVLREFSKNGYNVIWKVLPASAVGFPHRRNRVWIFAYPGGKRFNRDVVFRAVAFAKQNNSSFRGQNPKKFELHTGVVAPAKWRSAGFFNPRPLFIRSDNGISSQLDEFRLHGLGNAVVPACARLAFRQLLNEYFAINEKGSNK